MSRDDFIKQVKALDYAVESIAEDRISFPYVPKCGRFRGTPITIGFIVNDDFPANAPGGVHVSPRLLPLKNGGEHPSGGIHASDHFGADWQYWSRPFADWNKTERTAKLYMEHIDRLFDQ
jgi:hypothetical protein